MPFPQMPFGEMNEESRVPPIDQLGMMDAEMQSKLSSPYGTDSLPVPLDELLMMLQGQARGMQQDVGQVVPLPVQPGPMAQRPNFDQMRSAVQQGGQPGSNVVRTPEALNAEASRRLMERMLGR